MRAAEWQETMGSGVKVLVMDTGFSDYSPHLKPREVRSFVPTQGPECVDGHGDVVCRIIASGDPFALGVAPHCELYVAKVAGGPLSWNAYLDAMDWAMDLGVGVINFSLAFTEHNQEFGLKLAQADYAGVIIVAAHNPVHHWPHSEDSVISAGTKKGCDVVASVTPHNNFKYRDGRPFVGTSASSATVAGMAACAKSFDPRINRVDFVATIRG